MTCKPLQSEGLQYIERFNLVNGYDAVNDLPMDLYIVDIEHPIEVVDLVLQQSG